LARAIQEVRAEELLNWVDIHAGEMIYVDAGTVHTIGPGSILVETQQNSDTTYRLYDYGRPREIHVEPGLAATKESTRAGKVKREARAATLVASSCFVVEKFSIAETRCFEAAHSPQIFLALEGSGVAESQKGAAVGFAPGDALVVPASVARVGIRPHRDLELLRMTLPAESIAEPETTLS
jgi:mannose-6-phosphate isomerase